jgi:toxin ParE1/3/4
MKSTFLLTPLAADDLREIAQYIKIQSPSAARMVVRRIKSEIRKVAAMPGIGHLREDIADESLRTWLVYSYLVIYRATIKPIQVVRILHGARDIGAIMRRFASQNPP